jgi:hypothetical protein
MEVATLIIATLALIIGGLSLGLQLASRLNPKPSVIDEPARIATQAELEAHFGNEVVQVPQNTQAQEIIKQAQDKAFNDSFEDSDLPYNGIDEEFTI